MAEEAPKTNRPPSDWLLGLTGGGYVFRIVVILGCDLYFDVFLCY